MTTELEAALKRAKLANERADQAYYKLKTFKATIREKATGHILYEEWALPPLEREAQPDVVG